MNAIDKADYVERVLAARRLRHNFLPSEILCGEHAWDVLLVVFLAQRRQTVVTEREALTLSGGSAAVSRRWIDYLEQEGLCHREEASLRDRRLRLTCRAIAAIENWIDAVKSEPRAKLENLASVVTARQASEHQA